MHVMSDRLVVLMCDGPEAASSLQNEVSRRGLEVIKKEEQTALSLDGTTTRLSWTCANPEDFVE